MQLYETIMYLKWEMILPTLGVVFFDYSGKTQIKLAGTHTGDILAVRQPSSSIPKCKIVAYITQKTWLPTVEPVIQTCYASSRSLELLGQSGDAVRVTAVW